MRMIESMMIKRRRGGRDVNEERVGGEERGGEEVD